ncbi:unnamed protein product [Parnassius apollo]|uniref:(apollo) hypothetical protein n=1 Tax=Parnassius apollo TaxID=110799 RepID=A0A8S3X5I2_PARAO|nr:unnamed protein product [Parnassius apollo]
MPATLSNKPAVMKRKPMKEILKLAEPSTSTDHYSECSVHQLHTKMEGNTSHKENLDPVTAMQAPVISTNPVVIKKRAEMVLGHYSERSVHRLYTKMEGNTSHKENLDPVTPMQDPVISTNPVVIKKRAETFLGMIYFD